MTILHVGATVERPPGPKYVAALGFAELTFPSSWPRRSTLAKWRRGAGQLQCAVVAPRGVTYGSAGPLRWDEGLEERFAWYLDALDALDAHAVIPTGSDVTTSPRDRDRLASFLARIPQREGRHIVWAPKGLWSLDLALPFAEKMGVLCAFDPLEDETPTGPVAYARLEALGGRQRFSEGLLYDLLEALVEGGFEEAYVALESDRSFQEAVRLQQLAADT